VETQKVPFFPPVFVSAAAALLRAPSSSARERSFPTSAERLFITRSAEMRERSDSVTTTSHLRATACVRNTQKTALSFLSRDHP
jgi:hypothetical protein